MSTTWSQRYDPLADNLWLSAGVAALPILFFLVALCALRMSGLSAALWSLAFVAAVAWGEFGMPPEMIGGAAAFGIACALWPICYIVVAAVWLYRLTVADGKFEIIRKSIESVSTDHRIQALLVALCLVSFLEGCAAFGTPIAICSAMLVELGFPVITATALTLVGNVVSGCFGAAGIPVIMGAKQAELGVEGLSKAVILPLLPASLVTPLVLVFMVDGLNGIRDLWLLCLAVGAAFAAGQSATLYCLQGPEVANIFAAVSSMAILAGWVKWQGVKGAPPQVGFGEPDSNPIARPPLVSTSSAAGISTHSSAPGHALHVSVDEENCEGTWYKAPLPSGPAVTVTEPAGNLGISLHPGFPPPLMSNQTRPFTDQDSQGIKSAGSSLEAARVHKETARTAPLGPQLATDYLAEASPWYPTLWETIVAWSPFFYLTGAVLIWSIEPFKSLFYPGTGLLSWTVLRFPIPYLHKAVMQMPPIKSQSEPVSAVMVWDPIRSSGSALVFSVILTVATAQKLDMKQVFKQLWLTLSSLWRACALISMVMALAFIANYAGISNTLGLALAGFGLLLPIMSPLMGWLGVFLTGSVVNSNVLFAKLQAVSAGQIGVSPYLLVAASTSGAAMAKSVSPQSLAIAAGAVGMTGRESEIMKRTLHVSLLYLIMTCATTGIIAFPFGDRGRTVEAAPL